MSDNVDQHLDASGLQCPMPLLKTKLCLNSMSPGERLRVVATDPGSARDIPAFLSLSSHGLESQEENENGWVFLIRCGGDSSAGGQG